MGFAKNPTCVPLPWHTSQVYRLPDLVPEPLQVPHFTLRESDSFLRVVRRVMSLDCKHIRMRCTSQQARALLLVQLACSSPSRD